MSLVTEKYVYDFGNLSGLVRGSVDVEDQDVTKEGPSVYFFRLDEVPVDEASGCSAVQEGFDRVEFTCVHSSDFHWQEQGGSSRIQGTDREELGQPSLPLGFMERSRDQRDERWCIC